MVTRKTGNPVGRPPKPAALKLLHGDAGAKKIREAVPTGRVKKPENLTAPAAAVWDLVAPDLIKIRVIGPSDVPAFAELLEAMVLLPAYRASMVRQLQGTAVSPGQTPAVYQYRTLLAAVQSGWAQFGMTPAARTHLFQMVMEAGQPDPSPRAATPEEAFFGG
jgi:phage terminase small subunit